MKLDAPDLRNEVVSLSLLAESDKTELAESGGIDAMWKWMPVIPTGTNYDSYFKYMLEAQESGSILPFTVRLTETNEFAGVIGFMDISRTHRRLRIAYSWFPEHFRGTAVPPASVMAMLERARGSRIRRVEFLYSATNERAIQSARKIGAKPEGVLRQYLRLADGGWADMQVLSLIDQEIDAAITLLSDRVKQIQLA